MHTTYDITLNQGADYILVLAWIQNERPMDLTGYTGTFTAKDAYGAAVTVLNLDSTGGLLRPVPGRSNFIVEIPAGYTEELAVDLSKRVLQGSTSVIPLSYQLDLKSMSGSTIRVLHGQVAFIPSL